MKWYNHQIFYHFISKETNVAVCDEERGGIVSRLFRTFLILSFIIGSLYGAAWRENKSLTLKKDEEVKVLVKGAGQERIFSFRWTLFTDKVLVVHSSFDRIVSQHMLYERHTNQSFRKKLLPALKSERDVPSILVVFKKFDEGSKTAQFDLLLFDKEKRVILEYLTKDEQK